MKYRFAAMIAVAVVSCCGLMACKADGLRKQAAAYDKIAEAGDTAAVALERSFATADAALAWVLDPVNQSVLALFPPVVKARVDQAIATGEDLRPILAAGVVEIRTVAGQFRDQAVQLRDFADAERAEWINLLGVLAISLTGAGGIGAAVGRVLGLGLGARQVAEGVNAARFADPQFEAAIKSGPAGDALKDYFNTQAPKAVRKVVEETKL